MMMPMLDTLILPAVIQIDINHWLLLLEEYRPWLMWGAVALLVVLMVKIVWRRISRLLRHRRPSQIHSNLQKYNIDYTEQIRKQKEQAVAIVATSTGNRLAGYRIVRQVEAVFVEGYRTPEEAIVALKATAAERGANAILNVQTERTSAGKCTASGDAVVADVLPLRRVQEPRSVDPPKSC